MRIPLLLALAAPFFASAQTADWPDQHAEYFAEVGDTPEYRAIQKRLKQGWNTWDSRSVLRHVLLPEGLALDLALKRHAWLDEDHLETALIGRPQPEGGPPPEHIRPGIHAPDGAYTRLDIEWRELEATVESGTRDGELLLLVTPRETGDSPFELIVSAGMAWNREGIARRTESGFEARLPEREIEIHVGGVGDRDPYTRTLLPHHIVRLDRPVAISTGTSRSAEEARELLDQALAGVRERAARFPGLEEAYLAVASGVRWNTIYEPRHDRVVSTVGRLWNEEYGGFALFGWDNFFLAYLTALWSRDLALANVIEHLRGFTAEGFAPNDNRGNGSKSWDRSQPPVGSLMVREIHRRFPEERWFLEASFDSLLGWNRWWPEKRLNRGLLSYGSHAAKNPFREPAVRTRRTAGYESGMDDSPMYEEVPFNREAGVLELQDVGLTSLYIADCRALAELARILGREEEARELDERGDRFASALDSLWVEEAGYYLNHHTDGELRPSFRRSPTLFYPLLAGVPDPNRQERLIREHLLNPEEFWGEFILPSTTRDDPSFPRQRYWKGAIWPPLNFLTYLGLRRAGEHATASELSSRSLAMFLAEWRRKGYVSENYSSITGAGDDRRLSSDPFHSWGALFGIMAFIEAGHLAPPEDPLGVR